MTIFEIIMTILNLIAVLLIPVVAVFVGQYLQERAQRRKDKMDIFKTLIESFGDRWMAEGQIRNIQQWEIKHSLDSTLSSNYGTSLQFLIQNNLVHESSWTSYGNPREYSLYPSIRNLLFNCPKGIQEALQAIKDKHYQELPF